MYNGEEFTYPRYYSIKASMGQGPGRGWKQLWSSEVRNSFKQEMLRYKDDFDRISITKENRIKNVRDWI